MDLLLVVVEVPSREGSGTIHQLKAVLVQHQLIFQSPKYIQNNFFMSLAVYSHSVSQERKVTIS